jgi:LysR substrate binding domain-containing protein
MEASSKQLATRVFGRDQSVRGLLRVSLAPTLATHLLMPALADFARLHPDIEVEILSSDEPVNLTNRETEVAIRVVYNRSTLPLNLHGLKGPDLFGAVYISRDRLAAWRAGVPERIRWIVKKFDSIPEWARGGEIPIGEVRSGPSMQGRILRRFGRESGSRRCVVSSELPIHCWSELPVLARTCTERFGCSRKARRARRSGCGSSRSSCPADFPPMGLVWRASRFPATDERQLGASQAVHICTTAVGDSGIPSGRAFPK